MHIYVLKFDRSVEVHDVAPYHAEAVAERFPIGQVFVKGLNSWYPGWSCLLRHRESRSNVWMRSTKVPPEVQLAALIVN